MTEPGQSAEELNHLTTDCSKAPSGHPSAENDAPHAETLAQWINSLCLDSQNLAGLVVGDCRDLSREAVMLKLDIDRKDLLTLACIGARLQLIAADIDGRDVPTLRMVQNNGR